MFLEALSTARDLGRLQEIAAILVRHGLGDAVRRLGMAGVLERAGRAIHWKAAQAFAKQPEVHVREALEELGPSFVKLGQILAGRTDLIPPQWAAELSKLHERAAPVPMEEIRAQLVEDLGAEPEEIFDSFDPTPLASASIAQVHRAQLKDGTQVVLKVRRPGIDETVDADLRLLTRLAEQAEERIPELAPYRPLSLVREFGRSLRKELDLRMESRNAERLRANLSENAGIVVPRIHSQWTTERLCVMDFLDGPSIGEWLREGGSTPAESARIAAQGADTVLRTIFVDGFFHADPHPGNVLLLPEGRLGLIDYGMVGSLPEARRLEFLNLLMALASRQIDEAVSTLAEWSSGAVDTRQLAQDCGMLLDRYYGLSLGDLDTTEFISDLNALLRENGLLLPTDVALLLKVFVTLDDLGRRLDPNFVMATHVEPFAKQAWREHFSARAVAGRSAREFRSLLTTLPRDLRQLALRIRRGSLHVDLDLERLEDFGKRLERSTNRLTVGLIAAALIIGTAISLTVPGGPEVLGLPLFGFLGFTTSLVAGVGLLWSILRSGRR